MMITDRNTSSTTALPKAEAVTCCYCTRFAPLFDLADLFPGGIPVHWQQPTWLHLGLGEKKTECIRLALDPSLEVTELIRLYQDPDVPETLRVLANSAVFLLATEWVDFTVGEVE